MRGWVAMVGLVTSATACTDGATGPALAHVWDLDVDVPAGWTRENLQIEELEGIALHAPGDDTVYLGPIEGDLVRPTARAWFDYQNHRYWNDEVTIVALDEDTLSDGWVATLTTQTRIRPTPDRDVLSQRRIGGRTIECGGTRPHDPSVLARAVAICKSARLTAHPGHGVHASPSKAKS